MRTFAAQQYDPFIIKIFLDKFFFWAWKCRIVLHLNISLNQRPRSLLCKVESQMKFLSNFLGPHLQQVQIDLTAFIQM